MPKFRVYGLDVWGHSHEDCEKYDCPGGDRCEGYSVNDRSRAGTVEIDGEGPAADIIAALVRDNFLTADCTAETIEVDGDPDFFLEVNRKSDGRYLLQLEPEVESTT